MNMDRQTERYRKLSSTRITRVRDEGNMSERSPACEMPLYRDKSLDLSLRLELWRAEKRKQQLSKAENKSRHINVSNNIYSGRKSNIPVTKTARLLNKKFQTPMKGYQSPSAKDTYKDTNLAMRTRLDLWFKDKGKTPQSPTMSAKRGFPKTPAAATRNQRRKTWCYTQPNNNNMKDSRTRRPSGILKRGSFTDKHTRKSCSFILRNKENSIHEDSGISPATSYGCQANSALKDGEILAQSLENCHKMLKENLSTPDEIVFSLDDIQRDYPDALRHALYWLCRAKLAEIDGDHERVVCMVEQAFAFSAQPEELVQKYFDEYKLRKETEDKQEERSSLGEEITFRTPYKTPSRELSKLDGEVFNSSVVKFCLIDSTPLRNRRKSAPEKPVLTPVRRTTRWERCGITHPKTIEENRLTVASLNELSGHLRSSIVYKPNILLPCQLDEEMRIRDNIEEF